MFIDEDIGKTYFVCLQVVRTLRDIVLYFYTKKLSCQHAYSIHTHSSIYPESASLSWFIASKDHDTSCVCDWTKTFVQMIKFDSWESVGVFDNCIGFIYIMSLSFSSSLRRLLARQPSYKFKNRNVRGMWSVINLNFRPNKDGENVDGSDNSSLCGIESTFCLANTFRRIGYWKTLPVEP